MKKKLIIAISIIALLVICILPTGGKQGGVILRKPPSVSEDGSKMTLYVGLVDSMGAIRTYKAKQDGDSLYITFYSTFGLNGSVGAKNEFEIDIDPLCKYIYFYNGNEGYKLVLEKNSDTNEWQQIKR